MKSCAAFGCTKRFKKGDGISFFSFPLRKPVLLKKWMVAMKRGNWKPTIHQRICSLHFKESDFYKGRNSRQELKPDAVPSIFDFSEHLLKKNTVRRHINKWDVNEQMLQDQHNESNNERTSSADESSKAAMKTEDESTLHDHLRVIEQSPRGVRKKCEKNSSAKQATVLIEPNTRIKKFEGKLSGKWMTSRKKPKEYYEDA